MVVVAVRHFAGKAQALELTNSKRSGCHCPWLMRVECPQTRHSVCPQPSGFMCQLTLQADRIGMTLPFAVRAVENEMMHLTFELDATNAGRFAQTLAQLALPRAA